MSWADAFTRAKGWDSATRVLMLAGKALPVLAEPDRTNENYINGCESSVWLKLSVNEDSKEIYIQAYSQGKIVRGLLQIVIEPLQNLSANEFSKIDLPSQIQAMNLHHLLSPSRNNGVAKVIERLQALQKSLAA